MTHATHGQPPALVFVHGFLDGAAAWDDLVAALGQRTAGALCVDLPGMGERFGEGPPGSLDLFANDVARQVLALDRPVVLVGHGMGAQVAELVAGQAPSAVRGLVLITPMPLQGTQLHGEGMKPFHALGGQPEAQRELRSSLSVNLDGNGLEKLGQLGDRVLPASVGILADIWNQGHALGAQPSRYHGPVLVVRGEADDFITAGLVDAGVTRRFEDPAVAVVGDAGHWPQMEQPQTLAQFLGEFLDSIQGAAEPPTAQAQGWTRAFEQKSTFARTAATHSAAPERHTLQEQPTVQRTDVEFEADGGVKLRGWLYAPPGQGRRPAITMAHGYAAVKEHGIEPFARAFAEAGFVVLLHDHRGFGASEGLPRQDVDPWRQIADWRRAISYLESLDVVDPRRIGLWGTSYAGGHAIVLGGTERRLKCVVAQVPTISGYEQGLRRIPPENVAAIEQMFADDERAQLRGEPPRRQATVNADPAVPAAYRARDAIDFYLQPVPAGAWENHVTVRSTRAARMYEPGQWIARVSPTPLLMVVAMRDTITLTDLELAAYERALQPKRLVTIDGGHFDPYLCGFPQSSTAAIEWFKLHLG